MIDQSLKNHKFSMVLNQTYKPTEVKQLYNQINSQYHFFKFKIYLVGRVLYEIAQNAYAFFSLK